MEADDTTSRSTNQIIPPRNVYKEYGVSVVIDGQEKYKCTRCDNIYNNKATLRGHIKGYHFGVTYPCPHCDIVATTLSNLHRHIKNNHPGVKFSCHLCDYTTRLEASLASHVATTHYETLPQQGTSHPIADDEDELADNGQDGRRSETPKVDDKAWLELVKTDHKDGQLMYSCTRCDKSCTSRETIRNHVRAIHLGVKLHCPYCTFVANFKPNLNQHICSVHHKIKCKCPRCPKTYWKLPDLYYHMKKVHHITHPKQNLAELKLFQKWKSARQIALARSPH